MNSGIAARQAAAKIFVRAPKAMGEILDSSQTPPRVKIEASRELRATAIGTGDDNRPAASEMFIIKIDLTAGGGGVEHMKKKYSTPTILIPMHSRNWRHSQNSRSYLTRDSMNDGGKSVFARFVAESEKEQPPVTIPRGPLLRPIVPPSDSNSPPIERLLDFIVNRWRKPVIRVREICQFGPGPIRDRKSALALAETLVAHGWLSPNTTRRHDTREWRIVRGGQQ